MSILLFWVWIFQIFLHIISLPRNFEYAQLWVNPYPQIRMPAILIPSEFQFSGLLTQFKFQMMAILIVIF